MKKEIELELAIPEYDLSPPDDSLAEVARLAPDLTAQERIYVYYRSIALPPGAAFKKAGYAGTNHRALETRPKIRKALQVINEELEPDYHITQKKVIGLLMQSVEIAIRKDQSHNLTEAAIALANVSGMMSAVKIQVNGNHQHSLTVNPQIAALQHLPRGGLEELVGLRRTLPALQTVEEGEFEVVDAI